MLSIIESIRNDQKIIELLQDDEFAIEFYQSITGGIFWADDKGNREKLSKRAAADLVAELRDMGEDHTDFINSRGEGTISDAVRVELNRLGWEED